MPSVFFQNPCSSRHCHGDYEYDSHGNVFTIINLSRIRRGSPWQKRQVMADPKFAVAESKRN
jgi:hypothetical protein